MSAITKKIDFVAVVSVNMANSNGDPLDGNRPRTLYDGYGEISDVCIKRKIRNRMQDMGQKIFVQSQDRCDDGYTSLSARAKKEITAKNSDKEAYAKEACEKWLDVRAFGQVFAFKKSGKGSGDDGSISVGVRGPVSIHQARSVDPIEVLSMQITKSVNGEDGKGRSSDTMGTKHMVRFGLYTIKGSVNVQLAEKTGFSDADAELLRECLRTLFVNDASSARPDGSMEVVKLFWFEHNCKDGQYSAAKVHRSVQVALKHTGTIPTSAEDYVITCTAPEGLKVTEYDGI